MKLLAIAFILFLFLLVLYLVNSYSGFFIKVKSSMEKAKEEWYSIGKVEISKGRIISINKTIG